MIDHLQCYLFDLMAIKVGSKKGGADDQDEDDAALEDSQPSQGGESQKAAMAKAKTKVR